MVNHFVDLLQTAKSWLDILSTAASTCEWLEPRAGDVHKVSVPYLARNSADSPGSQCAPVKLTGTGPDPYTTLLPAVRKSKKLQSFLHPVVAARDHRTDGLHKWNSVYRGRNETFAAAARGAEVRMTTVAACMVESTHAL